MFSTILESLQMKISIELAVPISKIFHPGYVDIDLLGYGSYSFVRNGTLVTFPLLTEKKALTSYMYEK